MSEPSPTLVTAEVPNAEVAVEPGSYWLRVHGFPPVPLHSSPFVLNDEIVYYNDFYDPYLGVLSGDPREHFRIGDVLIYYADGGAVIYALATVIGDVEGPIPDAQRGQVWRIPIRRDALIRTVNKAPHAMSLAPPSGWHFLRAVRDYTYIRLPRADGVYLADQVRARASAKD